MNYWLFKTEPDAYSIHDLESLGRDMWEGIRNYQARNLMRDQMKLGDKVFIYHSSCKQIGIVGVAEICREAYPDPVQFDPENRYFDPKSDPEAPRWLTVDIQHCETWSSLLAMSQLRETPGLEEMALLKRGQRLSVQPVSQQEWAIIQDLYRNLSVD